MTQMFILCFMIHLATYMGSAPSLVSVLLSISSGLLAHHELSKSLHQCYNQIYKLPFKYRFVLVHVMLIFMNPNADFTDRQEA